VKKLPQKISVLLLLCVSVCVPGVLLCTNTVKWISDAVQQSNSSFHSEAPEENWRNSAQSCWCCKDSSRRRCFLFAPFSQLFCVIFLSLRQQYFMLSVVALLFIIKFISSTWTPSASTNSVEIICLIWHILPNVFNWWRCSTCSSWAALSWHSVWDVCRVMLLVMII